MAGWAMNTQRRYPVRRAPRDLVWGSGSQEEGAASALCETELQEHAPKVEPTLLTSARIPRIKLGLSSGFLKSHF